MFLPHEFVVLSYEDVCLLVTAIKELTLKNKKYNNIEVNKLCYKLNVFMDDHKQWEKLRYFNEDNYERVKDDYYD